MRFHDDDAGKKEYECRWCPKTFPTRAKRNNHVFKEHGGFHGGERRQHRGPPEMVV